MRGLKLLIVPFLTLLVMMGCQTDYDGQIIPNQEPNLAFNTYSDTAMYLTKRKVRVGWHCNDVDGMKTKFYYAVSASRKVNTNNVLDSIPAELWRSTDKSYADIAFPFDGDSTRSYLNPIDSTYIKYVWSRVYLYAVDEDGNRTSVISRDFWRTNNKPSRPRVECPAFLWDAEHLPPVTAFVFADYQATTLPRVFLREQTSFWNPVVFRWSSEDEDSDISDKVILEYKWELYKITYDGVMPEDSLIKPSFVNSLPAVPVLNSGDWDNGLTSVALDDEVYNAGEGYFKFIVRVKDDGNEESASPCVSVFEAFRPIFDKGIFLYNTTTLPTDPGFNTQSTTIGNPDKEDVKAFYKQVMADCGYSETSTDPLKKYEYYDLPVVPNLKKLSQYRLIISVDDDRLGKASTFNDDKEMFFGAQIREYLNMGGKIMVSGTNRFYDNVGTSHSFPTKYPSPKPLIKDYFGLAAVTTSEGYQAKKGDHFNDYDCIGLDVFTHVQDGLVPMNVDSVIVNNYWSKSNNNNNWYKVKGNGMFLPGVSTVKALDGEIIYGYRSIYNQPSLDPTGELRTAGGWSNGVVDSSTIKPVLNRNEYDGLQPGVRSAVASRYIPDANTFRTAYIGLPLFFMDNNPDVAAGFPNGRVTFNMNKMINWFDLTQVPQSVVGSKK